jgi:hypothetical protein
VLRHQRVGEALPAGPGAGHGGHDDAVRQVQVAQLEGFIRFMGLPFYIERPGGWAADVSFSYQVQSK